MLFINYPLILLFAVPAMLIALSIWGYSAMRDRRGSSVWLLARIAAVGGMLLSSCLLLFIGWGMLWTVTSCSKPIFSPDHKRAARVTDEDAGALGGDTAVKIFTNYGFYNGTILTGDWKIVEAKDIHWLNNSELLITYPVTTGDNQPHCKDFGDIRVICKSIVMSNR